MILVIILITINSIGFSQISLISYGIVDGDVLVSWKTSDTNISFSIYRSPVLISNVTSFSNNITNIKMIGRFSYNNVAKKGELLYITDPTPNIGTNYYFILPNREGKDIISFFPEQNYSTANLIFIPIPKVEVEYDKDLRNTIIKWNKVSNIDGYLIYKIFGTQVDDISRYTPIAKLSPEETIFFDVLPSDTNVFYVVIPFSGAITNFYFSKKHNSIIVSPTRDSIELIQNTNNRENIKRDEILMSDIKNVLVTNYITNTIIQTNTLTITNLINITNFQTVETRNKQKKESTTEYISNSETIIFLDENEIEEYLKEIVRKYFNTKRYYDAKIRLKDLLSNTSGTPKIRGLAMVYLARAEYALGNKNEAIDILFKARAIIPEEADFWLNRFLVNR
ncbi:MAG: hypothetical protein N2712_01100 [Brevinematales bacterium]|nr:hypothetical protein [Brevinematales bacterium]